MSDKGIPIHVFTGLAVETDGPHREAVDGPHPMDEEDEQPSVIDLFEELTGKDEDEVYDPYADGSVSAPPTEEYYESVRKDWEPYEGPRGGEGWRHTETGRISYTDDPPGTDYEADSPDLVGEIGVEASDVLADAGHDGYVVGGTVRDHFLGVESNDIDMTTDAHPDEVTAVFEAAGYDVYPTGIDHGTVTVMMDGEPVEITTYRVEEEYEDARRPEEVEFVDTVEEDLARRDLTINAMAYDPRTEEIVDPYGGQEDLEHGRIQAVGDPIDRFTEDGLRPLRALRFQSKLDFDIEEGTWEALLKDEVHESVSQVAEERIQEETDKALKTDNPRPYFEGLLDTGLVEYVIPELSDTVGVEQPPEYHEFDVKDHILTAVEEAPEDDLEVRLAALLHDIGKPDVYEVDEDGRIRFFGHPEVGAEKAEEILERLRYDNDTIDTVTTLVERHMDVMEPDMSDSALRRLVERVGEDNFEQLIRLRQADLRARGREEPLQEADEIEVLIDRYEDLEERGEGVQDDLEISGHDIMGMGLDPGPAIGEVLGHLHELVTEDPSLNDSEFLQEEAQRFIDEDLERMFKDWEGPFEGPRGGVYWEDSGTGRRRYTEPADEVDVPFREEEHDWWKENAENELRTAESRTGLFERGVSGGVNAMSMEVFELSDGSYSFVTHYKDSDLREDSETSEAYKREATMITYELYHQLGDIAMTDPSVTVPPHYEEESGAWVASLEFDGMTARAAIDFPEIHEQIDRDEFLDAAALQLLLGNIDLHTGNVMVNLDGEFCFIDLDHSSEYLGDYEGEVGELAIDSLGLTVEALGHMEDWGTFEDEMFERMSTIAKQVDESVDLEGVLDELAGERSAVNDGDPEALNTSMELLQNVERNFQEAINA